MKLRLAPRALEDLEHIADYLRRRNPAASLRVRDAIEAGLKVIAQYPDAGRLRRLGVRRLALPRLPYLIFYRIDRAADQIVILTIRHGARKPLT